MSRSEYTKAAHERSCVSIVQRLVLDRFIASDTPAKEVGICEEAFLNESQIPQEAWQNFLEKLGLWENDARTRMSEFKWMRDPPSLPFLKKSAAAAAAEKKKNEAKPKKQAKRRRAEPEPEGGGGNTPE